jgi:hypothetical protein
VRAKESERSPHGLGPRQGCRHGKDHREVVRLICPGENKTRARERSEQRQLPYCGVQPLPSALPQSTKTAGLLTAVDDSGRHQFEATRLTKPQIANRHARLLPLLLPPLPPRLPLLLPPVPRLGLSRSTQVAPSLSLKFIPPAQCQWMALSKMRLGDSEQRANRVEAMHVYAKLL